MQHAMEPYPARASAGPRSIDLVIAGCLMLSLFVWPHTFEETVNVWAVGLTHVAVALVAAFVPRVRFLVALLGTWLFVSIFVLPTRADTAWFNAAVGIGMWMNAIFPLPYEEEDEPKNSPNVDY